MVGIWKDRTFEVSSSLQREAEEEGEVEAEVLSFLLPMKVWTGAGLWKKG